MVVDEAAAQDRVALPKTRKGKSMKLRHLLKRKLEHHIAFDFQHLELVCVVMSITGTGACACSSWFALFLVS
jgi:hypothetical protein